MNSKFQLKSPSSKIVLCQKEMLPNQRPWKSESIKGNLLHPPLDVYIVGKMAQMFILSEKPT